MVLLRIPDVQVVQGHLVHVVPLGLDPDAPIGAGGRHGDDVQVDAGRQHPAVVVIGVVAADFGAPRRGEENQLLRLAEGVGESGGRLTVPVALGLHPALAVQAGEQGVVGPLPDTLDKRCGCGHSDRSFRFKRIFISAFRRFHN